LINGGFVSGKRSFDAVIQEGRGGGAFVAVPFDVKAEFGSARPKVLATFDGEAYRGTIVSMGGVAMIGMLKEIRAKLKKDIGDRVRVTVEADAAPREVELPADLRQALRAAGLEAAFDRLSYTHRKEYVKAVEEAKRPETRQRRIEQTIEALR
jgi:hypothetical protein